ncbi:hypothetical protein GT3570_16220 [Geobacillus thermoleovorans]|nr:hypothetical protein GT3570_16220 [Geobacillus thermoleovorans]
MYRRTASSVSLVIKFFYQIYLLFKSLLLIRIPFGQLRRASSRQPLVVQQFFRSASAGKGNTEVLFNIGLQEFGVPRRSDILAQFRGSRGEHELLDLFLLFCGEKRVASWRKISMKQEFQAAFVEQRHIVGNGLSADVGHVSCFFAQIAFPSPTGLSSSVDGEAYF